MLDSLKRWWNRISKVYYIPASTSRTPANKALTWAHVFAIMHEVSEDPKYNESERSIALELSQYALEKIRPSEDQ